MASAPMTAEQLERAKDSRTQTLPAGFQTSQATAASFAQVYVYDLGLDYYSHVADRVNAVTADQALAAAKKYLVAGADGHCCRWRSDQDRTGASQAERGSG